MLQSILTYLEGQNLTLIVSVMVFAATVAFVLGVGFLLIPQFETQRAMRRELEKVGIRDVRTIRAQDEIRRIGARKPVEAWFKATEQAKETPDALELRLFQAGFYSDKAVAIYNVIRVATVVVVFLVFYPLLSYVLPAKLPGFIAPLGAGIFALAFIVVPSVMLDRYARRVQETYRRGFPDFMDMMITCADAGMSLEAAVERVSAEMAVTHRDLGIQLAIMTLQLRAGRTLREALRDLADRIGIDEARSLAVLFRQSEELGTSLVDALRVYSEEMRSQRILRAEEKANSLPVKMMIPLGFCVFPVIMMIIMLPLVIRMRGVFY
jgi:tight adherence protein C